MADSQTPEVPILSRLRAPAGAVKNKLRKGRGVGGGLGKTAGKGQKGQKARSPGDFQKLGFEGGQTPLYRRLPKRGFKNPFSKNVGTYNVKDLQVFDAGTVVDLAAVHTVGVLKGKYDVVKVLGDGEIDKALTVKAHAFSASAREKIEKAGGTCEVIELAAAPSA